ncbi:PfkB family carbohydrate kinase [Devosia sp. UYZn731]|uniref:PfkB family carbohydrate kinase n=1 Tax=Devosia sp. UYZn731 TaxID=3156345 RepID=UPI003397B3D4
MTDGDDLIVGAVLIDNLLFADGSRRENIPGGAGLYALAGASLFSADPVLVTGTGRDLPQTFGPWMVRNGLTQRGLRFADAHAPRNILQYAADGGRTETPVYGQQHFSRIEPTAADVAGFAETARSLYVFRNTDGFWEGLDTISFARRPLILWEIALDACNEQNRTRVEAILPRVDALSINLDEASRIFALRDEDAIVSHLLHWPVRNIFLRLGARGSYAIANRTATFVPSAKVTAIDVTGGGNAYSGGALIGLSEGRMAREAAIMGTVAASHAISQYGPPETGDPALRAAARQTVLDITSAFEEPAK